MTQMQEQPCLEQTKIHAHERKWLLCISVSMCLFALGAMHITSEKTNQFEIILQNRYYSRYDCYHDCNTGLGALACLPNVSWLLCWSGCSRYKTSPSSPVI